MTRSTGDRKQEILEMLATMLANPIPERITTALLAEKMGVSEAALYRHFASKTQMFEGLIQFIEDSILGLFNKITSETSDGVQQIDNMVMTLLLFAEKNPGMTRVLIGDVLMIENERLQYRINQLIDKIEVSFKQALRFAEVQYNVTFPAELRANIVLNFIIGSWQQFAKSGFKKMPTKYIQQQLRLLIPQPKNSPINPR